MKKKQLLFLILRTSLRITYVFLVPIMLLLSAYLVLFLSLNSLQGAQLALSFINNILPGTLSSSSLEVDWRLNRIAAHNIILTDLDDQEVITGDKLVCEIDLLAIAENQIIINNCYAEYGNLLIKQNQNGGVGFTEAISGRFSVPRFNANPPSIVINNLTLHHFDLLMDFSDIILRFDSIDLAESNMYFGNGRQEINLGFLSYQSGRVLMSERMFSLGSGKPTWEYAAWEIQRSNNPWHAYQQQLSPVEEQGGVLDLPLLPGSLASVVSVREGFQMEAFDISFADGGSIFADGYLGFFPEKPRISDSERSGFSYEGYLDVSMQPGHPFLEFFVPGMIARPENHEEDLFEPFRLTSHGNLHFSDAAASIALHDVLIRGWHVDELAASIRLENGIIHIEPGAYADLWNGHVDLAGEFVVADGSFQATLCLDRIQMNQIMPFWEPGSTIDQWLSFRLSTTPARCPDPTGPIGMTAQGDLTRKGLWINPALSTIAGRPVGENPLSLDGENLILQWEQPPPNASVQRFDMDLHASVTQRGTWLFEQENSSFPGITLDGAGMQIEISGGWIPFENALTENTRLHIQIDDLYNWLAPMGIETIPSGVQIDTSFDLTGPFSDLQLQNGTLSAQHEQYANNIPDFELSTRFRIDGDDLVLSRTSVESSVGEIESDGKITIFDDGNARAEPRLDIDLQIIDLQLGRLFPAHALAGMFNTSLHVGGKVGDFSLVGELLANDLFIAGEPIDIIQTNYELDDDRILLHDTWLLAGKGRIHGELIYDLDSSELQADFEARAFSLDDFRTLTDRGIALDGELDFNFHASGFIDGTLDIEGSAVITDFSAYDWDLGSLYLAWDTFDGVVDASGILATDVNLDMTIPLDLGPIAIEARVQELSIANHWLPFADIADNSRLTASLQINLDPFGETPSFGADLLLDSAEFEIGDQLFHTPHPAHMAWQASFIENEEIEQEVLIEELAIGIGEHFINIDGLINNFSDVDFTMNGTLDAALLKFFPFLVVDADGVANVNIEIGGTLQTPDIDGIIDFEQIRIALRALGTNLFLRSGSLLLTTERVQMLERSPIRGSIYGGDFTAWGEIPLERLIPFGIDLNFEFNNVAYSIPNEMNVVLHGQEMNLFVGNFYDYDSWSIAGNVELADGRYYNNIEFVDFGIGGRTAERFELPAWQRIPLLGAMHADLTIFGRDNFFFESTISSVEMDVELQTDLRLTGTFGAMNLQGEMNALPGSVVIFRGRTLDIEEGRTEFDGFIDEDGFPWPLLDGVLTANIRPCGNQEQSSLTTSAQRLNDDLVRILVRAEGRAPLDFEFELESTPFHDQRDILALILTGCTVDALASSTGGATIDIVLSPLFDIVESELEEYLDVDDVDINPTAEGNATIRVEDELSERVNYVLNATIGTDSENEQRLTGEFRIFDWLSFELTEGSGDNQNVGVQSGFRIHVALD